MKSRLRPKKNTQNVIQACLISFSNSMLGFVPAAPARLPQTCAKTSINRFPPERRASPNPINAEPRLVNQKNRQHGLEHSAGGTRCVARHNAVASKTHWIAHSSRARRVKFSCRCIGFKWKDTDVRLLKHDRSQGKEACPTLLHGGHARILYHGTP